MLSQTQVLPKQWMVNSIKPHVTLTHVAINEQHNYNSLISMPWCVLIHVRTFDSRAQHACACVPVARSIVKTLCTSPLCHVLLRVSRSRSTRTMFVARREMASTDMAGLWLAWGANELTRQLAATSASRPSHRPPVEAHSCQPASSLKSLADHR